jgi:hypothetical protein
MLGILAGKALSALLVPFGWVLAWAMDVDFDWDDGDPVD